jgi:hypothetical protein
MISKDDIARWKADPTTQAVIDELENRLDWLMETMAVGGFYNESDMEETFALTSKALGEIQGLQTFFHIVAGMTDEDAGGHA